MQIMLVILTNNIIPIFLLVAIGFVLAKKFSMDIATLNKINFYVLVPSFTFVYLYTTEIPLDMIKVLGATLLMLVINYWIAVSIAGFRKNSPGLKNAFANSVMFYNSGNIGVPLITLVFSSPPFVVDGATPYLGLALTSQIVVLAVQNISVNTLGFFNAGRAHLHMRDSLIKIFKMPAVYAIPSALLLKLIPHDLTQMFFWPALAHLRSALVPTALMILGIQISKTKFSKVRFEIVLSVFLRLFWGPLLAFFTILLFDLQGVLAQALFISAAVPTAVNTALIAVEYDNYPDFASQVVLLTTVACTLTLSIVIYLSYILFPIL